MATGRTIEAGSAAGASFLPDSAGRAEAENGHAHDNQREAGGARVLPTPHAQISPSHIIRSTSQTGKDTVVVTLFCAVHDSDSAEAAAADQTRDDGSDESADMSTAAQRWPRPMATAPTGVGAVVIPSAKKKSRQGAAGSGQGSPLSARLRAERNTVTDEEKRLFLEGLGMTEQQANEAENTPQRTEAWFNYRRDRLSASLFGGAAGHNKYETREGVIKKMLWSEPFSNPATEYGTALEATAFASVQVGVASALQQRGYGTVWFEETGTRIFAEHPWLCASADGIVYAVDGPDGASLKGVLELKAPYKKAFYEPTPHYYFDQFSGQARIHNVDFIVFGVYKPSGTQINYFKRDADYWDNVLFPALCDFYMNEYMWRAILRDKGRIQRPNIDPIASIPMSPFDFVNYDRVEAERAAKRERDEEDQRRAKRARLDEEARVGAAVAAVPDPWETCAPPVILHSERPVNRFALPAPLVPACPSTPVVAPTSVTASTTTASTTTTESAAAAAAAIETTSQESAASSDRDLRANVQRVGHRGVDEARAPADAMDTAERNA